MKPVKLNRDGLPANANDWTEEDWLDLYESIEAIKQKVKERHAMKKTVTETKTRIVEVCDLCERDCSNGFSNRCYICGRQTCMTCSRLIEFCDINRERERRILELPLKVCHECEEAGDKLHHIERLEAVVAGADVKTVALIDEWKNLAKRSKGK